MRRQVHPEDGHQPPTQIGGVKLCEGLHFRKTKKQKKKTSTRRLRGEVPSYLHVGIWIDIRATVLVLGEGRIAPPVQFSNVCKAYV